MARLAENPTHCLRDEDPKVRADQTSALRRGERTKGGSWRVGARMRVSTCERSARGSAESDAPARASQSTSCSPARPSETSAAAPRTWLDRHPTLTTRHSLVKGLEVGCSRSITNEIFFSNINVTVKLMNAATNVPSQQRADRECEAICAAACARARSGGVSFWLRKWCKARGRGAASPGDQPGGSGVHGGSRPAQRAAAAY